MAEMLTTGMILIVVGIVLLLISFVVTKEYSKKVCTHERHDRRIIFGLTSVELVSLVTAVSGLISAIAGLIIAIKS